MKQAGRGLLVVWLCSLGVAPSAWAKCESLYAAVQDRLKQVEAKHTAAQSREEAERCAERGIKHHRRGEHGESMQTLRQCVKMLGD